MKNMNLIIVVLLIVIGALMYADTRAPAQDSLQQLSKML